MTSAGGKVYMSSDFVVWFLGQCLLIWLSFYNCNQSFHILYQPTDVNIETINTIFDAEKLYNLPEFWPILVEKALLFAFITKYPVDTYVPVVSE